MRKDIDMLSGPLGPAVVRFTIPVILTTLLQTLFNTIARAYQLGDIVVDPDVHTTICTDILYDAVGNAYR